MADTDRKDEECFWLLRDMIYQNCGIYFADHKRSFLEIRFLDRMKALNLTRFGDYYNLLRYDGRRNAEMKKLIEEVTTNETYFFRNVPQLKALQEVVIPSLVEHKEKLCFRKIRIWSAASSSGEEPYTIAMILMEMEKQGLKGWNWEIIGTDISDTVLIKAKKGCYNDYSMRNVPENYRKKYFIEKEGLFHLSDEVKRHVQFRNVNLFDDVSMVFMKGFDIIFCCNVLIYFDFKAKSKAVQHFFNNLQPEGYLYIGHAETLYGINDNFKMIHFPGGTVYQKKINTPVTV